jgi:hypothetical protein
MSFPVALITCSVIAIIASTITDSDIATNSDVAATVTIPLTATLMPLLACTPALHGFSSYSHKILLENKFQKICTP